MYALICKYMIISFLNAQIDTAVDSSYGKVALDGSVILVSIIFVLLCGRSLLNTLCLACRIKKYEPKYRWKIFSPLINFWHVGAIISNLLAFVGSIMKIFLTYNVSHTCKVI